MILQILLLLLICQPVSSEPREPSSTSASKRELCGVCDEFALPDACSCYDFVTQEMAESLLQRAETLIAKVSSDRIRLKRSIQVRVISSPELEKLGGEHLLGLYEDSVIWLSFELNRRQALAVIGHEFGHAWFFQHRPDALSVPDLLYEGFPEFLSYLVLNEAGDHEACYTISSVDQSVYGRGARRLIGLYYRAGLDAVLKLALSGSNIEALSEQAY